jgi:2-C-methyl-D-erythritol 4-phosphate cytidylyltransferase
MAIFCASKAFFDGMNAEDVEALAYLEGVRLALEWSRSKTIIESDCLSAVLAACRPGVDKSQLAFIVNDIKHVSRMLAEVRFQYVRREQNEVAHELAQFAKRMSHSAVWHAQVPQCVESLIAKECTLFHE